MIVRKLIVAFFVLTLSVFVFCLAATLVLGYQGTITFILHQLPAGGYGAKIFYPFFSLLKLSKFRLIQGLFLMAILGNMALFYQVRRISNAVHWFLDSVAQSIVTLFSRIIKPEALAVLIMPLGAYIYFACSHPVFYDEAWTFMNYSSRSILSSILNYNSTNNHILHSIFTNVTYHLTFLPYLIRLRIPAIAAGFLTQVALLNFLSKYQGRKMAAVAVAICSTLFLTVYYSYFSRGYALDLFFFVLTLHAAFNIVYEGNRKIDWLYYSATSVLGFYTMPLFLYPFAIINIGLFALNYRNLKWQIICNVGIVFAVLWLYAPPLYFSHLAAFSVTANKLADSDKTYTFFIHAIKDIVGVPAIYLVPFLMLGILGFWNNKKAFVFLIIFLLFPLMLLVTQSFVPISRSFLYYGVILTILTVKPFERLIVKANTMVLVGVCIALQILLLWNFNNRITTYEDSFLVNKDIRQIEGNHTYLTDYDIFSVRLQFDLFVDHVPNYKLTYCYDVPMSADTINQYDYVIIGRTIDRTITKKPFIYNTDYAIYKK